MCLCIYLAEKGYEEAEFVKMPIIDVVNKNLNFLPLAVPKEYLSQLERLHSAPFAWWAGQIISYLMRFNSYLSGEVAKFNHKLDFYGPCVG